MKTTKVVSILLYPIAVFGMNSAYADDKLENRFLDCLEKEMVTVNLYLVNGIRLEGQIGDHDKNVILLKGKFDQMVYTHAISTIAPLKDLGSTCLYSKDDKD